MPLKRRVTHFCYLKYLGFSCRTHVPWSLEKTTLPWRWPCWSFPLSSTHWAILTLFGAYSIFPPPLKSRRMSSCVPPQAQKILSNVMFYRVYYENSRCYFFRPYVPNSKLHLTVLYQTARPPQVPYHWASVSGHLPVCWSAILGPGPHWPDRVIHSGRMQENTFKVISSLTAFSKGNRSRHFS